ncbi:MFS transporter [Williamsia sp. 1135]|uniref:MFS transporter n=1 Tax=Williamsia sp. 1135 TaxID=1889262 RepID=UPI000A10E1F6|nr:MFS transporter [Williamsia sp. 1135]ORM33154.1 MFS transporter [Williamsia sp. 1135]
MRKTHLIEPGGSTSPDTAPPDRRWWALVALCGAVLLVMIDNTIVNVALPTISRDLAASNSGLQWVVDAYTLTFAGLLLTAGHFADRFGRRRLLVIGVVGFAAVSVLAAESSTLGQLIATRAGLGLFAAMVFPATLAILIGLFPDLKERAIAVGIWAGTSGISVAVGPVLGGWLLEHYSWSSVFWVNLPIAAAVLAGIAAVVPSGGKAQPGPFDLVGAVTSIAGVSLLVYTLIEGPNHGWGSVRTITGFIGAALILAVFVLRELRSAHPILNVRLFKNRPFAVASGLIAVAFFSLFGFIFLITQYFQAVKGYGPLDAGLHTLPFAIVMAVFSPLAMVLARTLGPGRVAALGSAVMASGFALVLLAGRDASYWGLIVWSMSLMAMGLAFVQGPATNIIMNSLAPQEAGAGSAVNDVTRELGGTLGVAVLGSVLSSVYTTQIGDQLDRSGLPAEAVEASKNSVMAGVQVAAGIPGPDGRQMLVTIQDAFVDGLHSSVIVAVVAAGLAAPVAWITLRNRQLGDPVVAEPELVQQEA